MLLSNLQALYYRQERHDEAQPAALTVLAARERLLGTDHPEYFTALHNMGTIY